MKRLFLLLIGILAFCIACQDNFVEPENAPVTKSAKYEKTKTHQVKGWMQVIPDEAAGSFQCETFGPPFDMCAAGWMAGHSNILGTVNKEESTYQKLYCELQLIAGEPVVYNEVSAELKYATGETVYGLGFLSINTVSGEVTGHTEFTDGTGRFKGITGTTRVVNGKVLPDGGLYWDTEGEITLVVKD